MLRRVFPDVFHALGSVLKDRFIIVAQLGLLAVARPVAEDEGRDFAAVQLLGDSDRRSVRAGEIPAARVNQREEPRIFDLKLHYVRLFVDLTAPEIGRVGRFMVGKLRIFKWNLPPAVERQKFVFCRFSF